MGNSSIAKTAFLAGVGRVVRINGDVPMDAGVTTDVLELRAGGQYIYDQVTT
jgi:isoaspartyl peptidase/L-asparaginase-like protein (Ntn-hydrolase superfamily)